MLERDAASKFRKEFSLRYPNSHVVLLHDAPRSGKKPYDSYIVYNGWFIALEFKITKGASIAGSCVTGRQLQCLKEAEKAGGIAYVAVFVVRTKSIFFATPDAWEFIFKDTKSIKIESTGRVAYDTSCSIDYPDEDTPLVIGRKRYDECTTWDFERWIACMRIQH